MTGVLVLPVKPCRVRQDQTFLLFAETLQTPRPPPGAGAFNQLCKEQPTTRVKHTTPIEAAAGSDPMQRGAVLAWGAAGAPQPQNPMDSSPIPREAWSSRAHRWACTSGSGFGTGRRGAGVGMLRPPAAALR